MPKKLLTLPHAVTPGEFVASLGFDVRLAPYDLEASAAHAEMLGRRKILSRGEAARLVKGLRLLQKRTAAGRALPRAEDVHFAIEKAMYRMAGKVAGKLHTARSRNDQTVTALRLYVRHHIDFIGSRLADLARAFVEKARANVSAVMPGYTHLQPGQPVLAAHHLLAYAWMFQRDRERLGDARKRTNRLPLGAAALAGTSFPIDREWVAGRLGFEGVIENSIDAVSDRDFLVEFLSAASLIAVHLSRWGEELVLWSNPLFGFVSLGDAFVTGSSIMPQKRNPDMAELLRGKTGRVVGDLTAMLTLLKAQPLAYNRDLQEDKPPLFDAVETIESCLDVAIPMARSMRLNAGEMEKACRQGYLLATDLADALAKRGLPFREAHGVVARVVECARAQGLGLEEMPLSVLTACSPLFGPWVKDVVTVKGAVAARASRGGTAPREVRRQIRALGRLLRRS